MATIKLGELDVTTVGELPAVGSPAPAFELAANDLTPFTSASLAGRRVVLNIFPSIDTAVCAMSVRRFNEVAGGLENTTVVCVSNDLPYAQRRFCGAEGIDNVVTASAFRSTFGHDYGVTFIDGRMAGLLSRSVVVIDGDGTVLHTEQVPVTSHEPDYEAALAVLG